LNSNATRTLHRARPSRDIPRQPAAAASGLNVDYDEERGNKTGETACHFIRAILRQISLFFKMPAVSGIPKERAGLQLR
jgi:hypothetical protein